MTGYLALFGIALGVAGWIGVAVVAVAAVRAAVNAVTRRPSL
jgi:F0F1-type ATP synthase membrane subunit c/vacuolar-type H+-ATPase subunit K